MDSPNKQEKGAPRGRPFAPGHKQGGRPKGTANKVTRDIREMIREALEGAGGAQYLITQAHENPSAFLALVGRIVPKEVTATIKKSPAREEVDAMLRRVGLDPAHVWEQLH